MMQETVSMASSRWSEIPPVVPEPREIVLLGGEATLAEDVRLVTRNVMPVVRKSMRTVLADAGVKVVANKKRFIVDVRIVSPDEVDLSRVPDEVRSEFYELEVRGNTAMVRALDQPGALWGSATLGPVLRHGLKRGRLPNLRIRDWPSLPERGLFIESKWGPDRMRREDWFHLIDWIADLKMNRLGIGLYNCWCCQYGSEVTEFLMVPVPDHPEISTEKTIRYFDPEIKEWQEETYLPTMFEDDFFGEVVAYAAEKGITVIPFLNSLGHNSLFPRMLPEVSAKNEKGEPVGAGYCLSSPETRKFLESFYGSIIERYFPNSPNGVDLFHVQLDEVYPTRCSPGHPEVLVDPWCQCPDCRARAREDLVTEYIVWLVSMLTSKGVQRVALWNDQLTRHMDILDRVSQALDEAGLKDRVVLHWWWYSNTQWNPKVDPALGVQRGLRGWVAPMSCYFNWSRYSTRLQNIEMMSEIGYRRGADGVIAYAVYDPAWADHDALLAEYAWNYRGVGPLHRALPHWAEYTFPDHVDKALEAREALERAASARVMPPCWYYTYTYYAEGKPWPRHYPEEALDTLEKFKDPAAEEELDQSAETASQALTAFREIRQTEGLTLLQRDILDNLAAEAARVVFLARGFAALVRIRKGLAQGESAASLADLLKNARASCLEALAVVAQTKAPWLRPAVLRDLSVLVAFMDQLDGDLAEVAAGKRGQDAVRWFVDES